MKELELDFVLEFVDMWQSIGPPLGETVALLDPPDPVSRAIELEVAFGQWDNGEVPEKIEELSIVETDETVEIELETRCGDGEGGGCGC